ncbi:MAG: TlpA disulfide reductase family protein [Acidobacteriota bacterium]
MLRKNIGFANWLLAGTLLFGILLSGAPPKTPRPLADVGIDAPGGKRIRLTDYKGKTLLIAILATDCKHCQDSIAILNEFQRTYRAKGLQIIAAAVDAKAPQNLPEFIARLQPAFPVGTMTQDNTRRLADFGITDRPFVPIFMFVDKKGTVRFQYSGDDGFFKAEKQNTKNLIEVTLR